MNVFSLRAACVIAAACASLAGCSSNAKHDDPVVNVPDAATAECDGDDSPEFTEGLTMPGKQGLFDVAISHATPVVPIQGTNQWVLTVTNKADGTPVTDATLDADCTMPVHTHHCAVRPRFKNNGDGTYTMNPLIFNMTSHWDITIFVTSGTPEVTDTSVFPVCIQ